MNDTHNKSDKRSAWTVRKVLEWTTDYFKQKGISSPRLDAEILLAYAMDVDRLYLYLNMDKPLSGSERDTYRRLVTRRSEREPTALITGKKEFWSIPLRVVPGVLIPRPDTETLVEVVLDEITGRSAPWILELGTGSGAVSIAVAHERPDARILATDIDATAAQLAKSNAQNAGVSDRIDLVVTDLFSPFRLGMKFDVICSNPPYVPESVLETLEPEIVLFEPRRGLTAGSDGLLFIREIATRVPEFLADDGALIMEIGDDQAVEVQEILASQGCFREIRLFPDLSGKPRVVKGKL